MSINNRKETVCSDCFHENRFSQTGEVELSGLSAGSSGLGICYLSLTSESTGSGRKSIWLYRLLVRALAEPVRFH